MPVSKLNTAKIDGKEYVLLPKKEYEEFVDELSQIEDIALGNIISKSEKEEYVDVDTFLKKARKRIARLRAIKKK